MLPRSSIPFPDDLPQPGCSHGPRCVSPAQYDRLDAAEGRSSRIDCPADLLSAVIFGGAAVADWLGWDRHSVAGTSRFSLSIFGLYIAIQLMFVIGMMATLVSPAIASERDRKTLDALLATNVSSAEIVLGGRILGVVAVRQLRAARRPVAGLLPARRSPADPPRVRWRHLHRGLPGGGGGRHLDGGTHGGQGHQGDGVPGDRMAVVPDAVPDDLAKDLAGGRAMDGTLRLPGARQFAPRGRGSASPASSREARRSIASCG